MVGAAIVNVGLVRNDGRGSVAPSSILQWFATNRRVVSAWRVAESDHSEPTLILNVPHALPAAVAHNLCVTFAQDCIAQSADGISGELLGPHAEQWRPFDVQYFQTI
jgi:hypothetical protein